MQQIENSPHTGFTGMFVRRRVRTEALEGTMAVLRTTKQRIEAALPVNRPVSGNESSGERRSELERAPPHPRGQLQEDARVLIELTLRKGIASYTARTFRLGLGLPDQGRLQSRFWFLIR